MFSALPRTCSSISRSLVAAFVTSTSRSIVEVTGVGHLAQERQRGARELHLGQVVRHVDGEAHRLVTGLTERELDPAGQMAGHLDRAHERGASGDQRRVGGVCGDADRAGVRCRPRDRVEADRAPYGEPLDDLHHGRGERAPGEVGLGTVQQQEAGAAHVAAPRRAAARGTASTRSGRCRRPCAGGGRGSRRSRRGRTGDRAVLVRREQVRDGELAGAPGVEEAGERVHEHRRVEVDVVGEDLVQALGLHGCHSRADGTTAPRRAFVARATPRGVRGFPRQPG